MKKYSITTTVNGKALVKQEHTFNTDGCTTSYGDVWGFESLTEAALWVDKELGNIDYEQFESFSRYFKDGSVMVFGKYGIPSDEVQQARANRMLDPLFTIDKDGEITPFKKDIGVDIDKTQVEPCVVNPETNKSLIEKIAEDEKVIND